jgi:hypothetical protein
MDQAHAMEPEAVQETEATQQRSPWLAPFQFTPERAAELARRGHAMRKAEAEAVKVMAVANDTLKVDGYVAKRIVQVRRQIEGLNERLEAAVDPKDIKALCDAISKLAELERVLAGRPLPGQRRPGKDAPTRRPATVSPLE